MQHLDIERIASFDHEPPTVDELAHLAACRLCRTERTAMLELSQMAMHAVGDVHVNASRLTNWESLSAQLRSEGLLTSAPVSIDVVTTTASQFAARHSLPNVVPFAEKSANASSISQTDTWAARVRPRTRTEWWRAAAAALVFVVGGAGLGRMSAGASFVPSSGDGTGVTTASLPGLGLGNTGFRTLDEANRALTRAQTDYERAAMWLAANDTTARSSEMVRTRLAALDQMVAASRAGLRQAPQDPVLNHYYYAAYAMREATLQQLGGALPVGRSIERF